MKLSTTFLAVSAVPSLVLGATKPVKLVIKSSDSDLNGKGLSPIHFGAGINGALVSDSVNEFQADEDKKTVFELIQTGSGPFNFYFNSLSNVLVTEPGEDTVVNYNDKGQLVVNGSSSKFFACSNLTYDPYGYTTTKQELGVEIHDDAHPENCTPISIEVQGAQGGNQSTNSTSSASPSAAPTHYGNSTTVQETKYTTIPCSTPTTVTYNSKTYTVTSATTLTVEDCGCEATGSASAPAPTSAPESSAPIAPAPNAAVRHTFGAAAVLAAAAYLI